MIKAAIGNTAILGLEEKNIEALQQNKPMVVKLKEIGLADIAVVIAYIESGRALMPRLPTGDVAAIGLDTNDIAKIKAGTPVMIKLKDLGLADIVVGIIYGTTQADIVAYMEKELGLKMPAINPIDNKPI